MKKLVVRDFNTGEVIASEPTRKKKRNSCIDDVKRLIGMQQSQHLWITGKYDYAHPELSTLHHFGNGMEITFNIEEA